METVKEKLKRLIIEGIDHYCHSLGQGAVDFHVAIADYLSRNGVTIQEWVSVDKRLPEESLNSVLGWDEYRERCVFVRYYKGEWILGDFLPVKIIAWMPLPLSPQPPKEVQ